MAKRDSSKQEDVANVAALTGHTTKPGVVEDENGKVQAIHTTEVITDPEDERAVQGHDDPRVDGRQADPLRRDPSPNEVAAGEAEADVTVSGDRSDEEAQAGAITDEQRENV